MPRFSPSYELVVEATDGRLLDGASLLGASSSAATTTITPAAGGRGGRPARPPTASTAAPHRARAALALSATAFFRADGTLDREAVRAAVARAGAELESRRKTS